MAAWLQSHQRSILLALAVLTMGGALSAYLLPVALFPAVDFPRILVSIEAAERPPARMAMEITQPLERALRQVPEVSSVRSLSSRGAAEISVEFRWQTDMVAALLQTQTTMTQGLAALPPGINFEARRMDPTVFPVYGVGMSSTERSLSALRTLAERDIAPTLSGIDGVAQVEVLGGERAEVQIKLDPLALQAHGLSAQDVANAVSAANTNQAIGRIEDRDRLYLVLTGSALASIEALEKLPVAISGGWVALRDLGEITIGSEPVQVRINAAGHDAVLLNIRQQPGVNLATLVAAVQTQLDAMRPGLPPDVHFSPYYDQSELVIAAASSVRDSIAVGALLAGAVLLLFLRSARVTALVSIVLPVVLLVSCVLLQAFGMSLNIMTLGGMAAAVGLVVDDAVVMIEHIARRLREQPGSASQLLLYSHEMMRPLIGSSLATIVVFLPLAFLGGIAGGFFRPLALTMVIALTVSLLVCALALPLLTRTLLRERDLQQLSVSAHWQQQLSQRCVAMLSNVLAHRRVYALPLLVYVLAGAWAYGQLGSGFMPKTDEGGFILDYYAAPGTSLSETDRLLRQVETLVAKTPEVASYSRRTGLQLGGGLTESNEGDLFIKLIPPPRRPIEEVMRDVRDQIQAQVPGLTIETMQLMEDLIGDLIANPQPVEIKLFGPDPQTRRAQAQRIATQIEKIKGIVEVSDGLHIAGDSLRIDIDPTLAALEGLDSAGIAAQLQTAIAGTPVGQMVLEQQPLNIRIWTPDDTRARVEQLALTPLRAPNGATLPLSRVASVHIDPGQPQRHRDAQRDVEIITARLEGLDLGSAIKAVRVAINGLQLPAGYRVEYGGLYREQQRAFGALSAVGGAALSLLATLLMVLYERVRIVLAITATALLTLPGVFIGLLLCGSELNLSSMMGLTMVLGIVTEVAIFFFAELKSADALLPEDLKQAAALRLRPILMTSAITVLALLPLALGWGAGAQMQQPLAITIISGLIVAVPMVLLLMPALVVQRRSNFSAGAEVGST